MTRVLHRLWMFLTSDGMTTVVQVYIAVLAIVYGGGGEDFVWGAVLGATVVTLFTRLFGPRGPFERVLTRLLVGHFERKYP